MSFLKRIFLSLAASSELRARKIVHTELMALPENRLADLGFDRAALEAGVQAWPWRLDGEQFVVPQSESQPVFSRRELRQAERELAAMSDRELGELGIARTDIRRAVNGEMDRVA